MRFCVSASDHALAVPWTGLADGANGWKREEDDLDNAKERAEGEVPESGDGTGEHGGP